ncbi:MAG: hypothetical protein QXX03_05540 [Nitrososphaerota archaeon]
MEKKKIEEFLKKEGKIYYAKFYVFSDSCYRFITFDSNPNFELSTDTNKELGLIKEISDEDVYIHFLPSHSRNVDKIIAFSIRPFKVLIRGIAENKVIEAKELTSLEKYFKLLE